MQNRVINFKNIEMAGRFFLNVTQCLNFRRESFYVQIKKFEMQVKKTAKILRHIYERQALDIKVVR
jgi:hypothetical protein